MSRREVTLAEVELPSFGEPTVEPMLGAAIYEARIDAALKRVAANGWDCLVVYADREHSANIAYLCGFEPRFEEALLILAEGRSPVVVVGNEGFGYVDVSPLDLRRVLCQSFSLLGQSRSESASLEAVFRAEGIEAGARVGVAGWKYFTEKETSRPDETLEIPSYIADTLRAVAGESGLVRNANAILMDASDGLRVTNELDQLARFEYAACHTSSAIKNVLFGLEPGMSEYDAVRLMGLNGMPLSCHLMLSSGERAKMGLPSPSSRRIERGDRFTTAFGVFGALNCRAGFVVSEASELPEDIRDYVDRLVAPYFDAIAAWYETIGIGVTGGELYDVIHERIGDPFFGVKLNPGHQIHLDEWVNSPVVEGSTTRLRSGMAFQVDVIPATGTAYFTTNIEDGIALADASLRRAFAEKYPEAWVRIERRRAFMRDVIGIHLAEEVLPFSNIPAYLPPFLLSPKHVMVVRR